LRLDRAQRLPLLHALLLPIEPIVETLLLEIGLLRLANGLPLDALDLTVLYAVETLRPGVSASRPFGTAQVTLADPFALHLLGPHLLDSLRPDSLGALLALDPIGPHPLRARALLALDPLDAHALLALRTLDPDPLLALRPLDRDSLLALGPLHPDALLALRALDLDALLALRALSLLLLWLLGALLRFFGALLGFFGALLLAVGPLGVSRSEDGKSRHRSAKDHLARHRTYSNLVKISRAFAKNPLITR